MENVGLSAEKNRIEYRALTKDYEVDKLEALLNESFEVGIGGGFFEDFPVWNRRLNPASQQYGAFIGTQLIGSASIRIAELKAPLSPCRVGIIGGVAIEPTFRGKGIATHLISECVKYAKAENLPLVILWGSEHSLYQKLGFELCGTQTRIPLREIPVPVAPSWREIHMGWNEKIFDLICTRKSGLQHSAEDLRWYVRHQNVEWYWIGPENDPKAYLAYNRGIDLKGMIHEWGGEKSELIKLLSFMKTKLPALELMGNQSLFAASGLAVPSAGIEFLCMAKILDPQLLIRGFLEVCDIPSCLFNGKINEREMVQVLFGPPEASGIETEVLPLDLWIWGLDSA